MEEDKENITEGDAGDATNSSDDHKNHHQQQHQQRQQQQEEGREVEGSLKHQHIVLPHGDSDTQDANSIAP